MKKAKYSLLLLLACTATAINCEDPFRITKCDHCSNATPWSIWNIDLSNPCFKTKSDCIQWGQQHLAGTGWECEKCNR